MGQVALHHVGVREKVCAVTARVLSRGVVTESVMEGMMSSELVGFDRRFPVADAHVNVRGHVDEMGRSRLHWERSQSMGHLERASGVAACLDGVDVEVQ